MDINDNQLNYDSALTLANYFNDEYLQKAIYDKFSNMSNDDILIYSMNFQISLSRYASGGELKPGYSLELDDKGNPFYGDSNFDLRKYLLNVSIDEVIYIFSTLMEAHKALEDIVGEQATWFANIYKDILRTYEKYKNS